MPEGSLDAKQGLPFRNSGAGLNPPTEKQLWEDKGQRAPLAIPSAPYRLPLDSVVSLQSFLSPTSLGNFSVKMHKSHW